MTVPMRALGSTSDPTWSVFDLHTDHLGSVRLETNDAGVTVSRHDYFPFGEEIAPIWSYNTHQFTGHERDQATGLDYMKARFYGAALPRFLSVDPVGGQKSDPLSWNGYTYVRNSPLTMSDPTGRCFASSGGDGSHPGDLPDLPGDNEGGSGGSNGGMGWGKNPCYMCFQRGDGWTDDQWSKFTTGANAFRKTLSADTKEHFRKKYKVDIDEYYTDGKGPVVNASASIKRAHGFTKGGWFGSGITMDLSDLFNPDGSMDQQRFEHTSLHESEHYANTPWHGHEPSVKEPSGVANKVREAVGPNAFRNHNDGSVIGFWAELIQFGSIY